MKIEKDIVTLNEQVKLENGTVVNRFSHIVKGAEVGDNCMIGEHVYVAGKAKLGNNVRVQNTNNIWDGVELHDSVFVAPSVVFTNHHDPSDRFCREKIFVADKTVVYTSATICANSTIVAPCSIGECAMIAGGSVVLRNVSPNERVKGIVK